MGHAASKEADRNAVGASSGAQIDHAAEAANMVRTHFDITPYMFRLKP
jgi:hypothetical protein